jgi:hypothetical protein
MVIREAQMSALSGGVRAAFEDQMIADVRAGFPQKTGKMSEEELRQIIRSGMDRAKQYGIELTFDVNRFIRLMFRFPSYVFEEDPATEWTKSILEDGTLVPDAKLDEVEGQGLIIGLLDEKQS